VYASEAVSLPPSGRLDTTGDPTAAGVAVYPADATVASIADSLQAGTVTAVVGEDAQAVLMQACASDGRSFGFARDSWGPGPSVVAANPRGDRIDTHLFVGVDLPSDLLWTLGAAFETAGPGCTLRQDSADASGRVTGGTRPVGASRIRGVNDAGGFDRWDRVAATGDARGAGYVVDIAGTIFAGAAARRASEYRSDRIRLVSHTDGQVESAGLGTGGVAADALRTDDRSRLPDGVVELAATADRDTARRSFTACQRAVVATDTADEQFGYTANGRFRWRNPGLFDDELWHHHTPGRAVWHPRW
jgi:hypothetical protein